MSDPTWVNAGRGDSVGTATIATTGVFTLIAHGLVDGQPVEVDTLTGGAATVLRADATYYVVNAAADTFQLVSAPGDEIITFGSSGGADVFTRVPHYSAIELRRADATLLYAGHANEFGARQGVRPHSTPTATVAGTTWTVQNLTAVVYPGLTALSGPYRVQHPSESGALNPADGTNPRIDALDLQIQDDDEDASGFRRARVVYVVGTPGATPVAPAVTANSLRLATVLVPAGGSPSPSVSTLAQFTVAAGGIVPVRTAAELPPAGRYEGMYADQADTNQLLRWDGSAWVVVGPAPRTVQATQTADILAFTDTSYVFGATTCGVTFTVPPSGEVVVNVYCLNRVNTTNTIFVAFSINDGITTGGTQILGPDDSDAYRHVHTGLINSGMTGRHVAGLTPGQEVTAWVRHHVSGGNGDIFLRRIWVTPQP